MERVGLREVAWIGLGWIYSGSERVGLRMIDSGE